MSAHTLIVVDEHELEGRRLGRPRRHEAVLPQPVQKARPVLAVVVLAREALPVADDQSPARLQPAAHLGGTLVEDDGELRGNEAGSGMGVGCRLTWSRKSSSSLSDSSSDNGLSSAASGLPSESLCELIIAYQGWSLDAKFNSSNHWPCMSS